MFWETDVFQSFFISGNITSQNFQRSLCNQEMAFLEISIAADSYYYDKNSAKASADDQTEAYKQAEEEMEKKAANDSALLVQVQQRVQSLLEDYVKNMGEVLEKEYTITWDIKENHVKPDTAESTE